MVADIQAVALALLRIHWDEFCRPAPQWLLRMWKDFFDFVSAELLAKMHGMCSGVGLPGEDVQKMLGPCSMRWSLLGWHRASEKFLSCCDSKNEYAACKKECFLLLLPPLEIRRVKCRELLIPAHNSLIGTPWRQRPCKVHEGRASLVKHREGYDLPERMPDTEL